MGMAFNSAICYGKRDFVNILTLHYGKRDLVFISILYDGKKDTVNIVTLCDGKRAWLLSQQFVMLEWTPQYLSTLSW